MKKTGNFFRPLSLEELITVAALPGDFKVHEYLLELIDLCSSFVTVPQRSVYFIHQSAKDLLTTGGAEKLYSNGILEEQDVLIQRSIVAMSETLQQDMFELKHLAHRHVRLYLVIVSKLSAICAASGLIILLNTGRKSDR